MGLTVFLITLTTHVIWVVWSRGWGRGWWRRLERQWEQVINGLGLC